MTCHGNGDDHCCWISGEVCRYLEENTAPGRRWACGLLRRAGSWPAVYQSVAYRSNVRPRLRAAGVTVDCGDWPQAVLPTLMANGNGTCCFEDGG
jgi:hypothetical protein